MRDEPPFDFVAARSAGGRTELSLEQFMQLPLPERIRIILESETVFIRDGKPVDRKIALTQLRSWTSAHASGTTAAK